MTNGQNSQGDGEAARRSFDCSAFLDAPIELLREQALARGSKGVLLIAKMFRIVAVQMVFGSKRLPENNGQGFSPPAGMSRSEVARRACDLLDLADELDGLG
jgi:hypothetical protein